MHNLTREPVGGCSCGVALGCGLRPRRGVASGIVQRSALEFGLMPLHRSAGFAGRGGAPSTPSPGAGAQHGGGQRPSSSFPPNSPVQVREARAGLAGWAAAWRRFGWIPEMLHWQLSHAHPTVGGYPLRPELVESTYLLYAATRDPGLLHAASEVVGRLRRFTRARCGHASVADVASGRLEDTMESFFLSETTKYLYLLFANATGLVDHFVLSTGAAEGGGPARVARPEGQGWFRV